MGGERSEKWKGRWVRSVHYASEASHKRGVGGGNHLLSEASGSDPSQLCLPVTLASKSEQCRVIRDDRAGEKSGHHCAEAWGRIFCFLSKTRVDRTSQSFGLVRYRNELIEFSG